MAKTQCRKCGGKLVYESYPAEEMLARKCFVCGRIDSYLELTRAQSKRLFRPVDTPVVPLAS